MALKRFRPSVGHRGIASGRIKPWQAAYGRAMRQQAQSLNKYFDEVLAQVQTASFDSLREAFEPVFIKSQYYVPFYTRKLKRSGFFEVRKIRRLKRPKPWRRADTIVDIGYAKGGDPPYAVIVHEDLEAYHYPPTRAKFLELALREERPRIPQRIKRYVGKELQVGG